MNAVRCVVACAVACAVKCNASLHVVPEPDAGVLSLSLCVMVIVCAVQVPLRLRANKLEEELRRMAPEAIAKVDAEQPKVGMRGPCRT